MSVVRVEKWGELYRLVKFKTSPDVERPRAPSDIPDHEFKGDEGTYIEEKWLSEMPENDKERSARFASSVARARSRIREIALCNDWQYFVTLTLSEEHADRFDLPAWVRALGRWIGNYNKKYNTKLKYIIIPEQHKNGAWHAHGLFNNVATSSLIRNENNYLDMPYYRARFGYISLGSVRDHQRVASYITKYVTKDSCRTADNMNSGAHLFYASRGLDGKIVVWQGDAEFKPTWENDFVGIKYTDDVHEVIETIMSKNVPHGTNHETI